MVTFWWTSSTGCCNNQVNFSKSLLQRIHPLQSDCYYNGQHIPFDFKGKRENAWLHSIMSEYKVSTPATRSLMERWQIQTPNIRGEHHNGTSDETPTREEGTWAIGCGMGKTYHIEEVYASIISLDDVVKRKFYQKQRSFVVLCKRNKDWQICNTGPFMSKFWA